MGFLDTIISTTVFKMKADASQAIAEAKKLSGEQKKAALAQGKALEEEGKAAEGLAGKYAKGAALIAAAYVVIDKSLDAYQQRSRLVASTAGIDLSKLRDAAQGLRTDTELLTLAQAGHQGAWKLTTQQLQLVTEGMLALRKKGYDATEVQNALTESLKKGKLEGLDKFGLSTKDLGNSTANLRSLMRQLARAADDVGHNFDMAGDSAVRAGVKFKNARDEVTTNIGKGVDAAIGGIQYVSGAGYKTEDLGSLLLGIGTEAERERRGISSTQRRMAKAAFDRDTTDMFGMIAGWKTRVETAKKIKQLRDEARGYTDAQAEADAKRRREKEDERLLELAGLSLGGEGGTLDQEQNRATRARALQDRIADAEAKAAADEERIRFEKAKALRQSKLEAETRKAGEKQNYLDSVFGPVEQFDAYAEGFRTLTDAVKASGDAILDSVIKGEKLTKASAGRAVAAVLGAESHKLWGLGLSTELQGWATLNPAMIAAGIAEMGGAFALGRIAASFGGSGASGSARGGANSRPSGFSQSPTQSTGASLTIVYGDSNNRDSPRFRAMETRRAVQMAGQIAPPQGVRNG